MPFPVGDHTPF